MNKVNNMQNLGLTKLGHQTDAYIMNEIKLNPKCLYFYINVTKTVQFYVSIAKHIHKLRYKRNYMLEIAYNYVQNILNTMFSDIKMQNESLNLDNTKKVGDMVIKFMQELFSPDFMPTSKRYTRTNDSMPIGYIEHWNDTESNDVSNNYDSDKYKLIDEFNTIKMQELCLAGKTLYMDILPNKMPNEGERNEYIEFINSYIALFASLTHIKTLHIPYMLNIIMPEIKQIILDDYNTKKKLYKCIENESVLSYSDNIIMTASKYNYTTHV